MKSDTLSCCWIFVYVEGSIFWRSVMIENSNETRCVLAYNIVILYCSCVNVTTPRCLRLTRSNNLYTFLVALYFTICGLQDLRIGEYNGRALKFRATTRGSSKVNLNTWSNALRLCTMDRLTRWSLATDVSCSVSEAQMAEYAM